MFSVYEVCSWIAMARRLSCGEDFFESCPEEGLICVWSGVADLNRRPHGPKPCALAN